MKGCEIRGHIVDKVGVTRIQGPQTVRVRCRDMEFERSTFNGMRCLTSLRSKKRFKVQKGKLWLVVVRVQGKASFKFRCLRSAKYLPGLREALVQLGK